MVDCSLHRYVGRVGWTSFRHPVARRVSEVSRKREVVIEAGRGERHYWQDLWRYRELFYFLAWRDILVRYKQTVIGIAWTLIRPLITLIVFTLVFGKLAGLGAGGTPYALVVFCGLLPWMFFANSFYEAANSLMDNTSLITKVYFPRVIIPASAVIVSLVELVLSSTILLALFVLYRHWPDWRMLLLPLFVALAFAAAIGAGLLLAALNVKYRDFRYVTPFIVQVGLYASPVGFTSALVPERWRLLFYLNPMVGVIDGFRWSVLGPMYAPWWPGFAVSVAVVCALLATGIGYFRSMERSFADVI